MTYIRNYKLDDFTQQYLETALWAETVMLPVSEDQLVDGYMLVDENHILHGIKECEPLDDHFSIDDLTDEAIEQAMDDCVDFQAMNKKDLEGEDDSHAGHDFWLTRNGHGAGFWDGDYKESKGERLTASSKDFGECTVHVNDDGKLQIFQG